MQGGESRAWQFNGTERHDLIWFVWTWHVQYRMKPLPRDNPRNETNTEYEKSRNQQNLFTHGEFLEETGMQENGTRSAVARELGLFVLIDFVMERMP